MNVNTPIERVARKYKIGEEPKNCEFWLTVSMTDRLDALLDLIAKQNGWTNETAPRLERVLAVVKQG